ncbi:hypothetical protein BZA05DRAFT_395869 [Tricharina praecox]|uniref:uncharacterized protein n=1 Tax=Tricharina praecox TaxID=43433 RepID=UPI0022203AF8|nr:uncharacterized protein BZA05DRAFT_395869 [Tricharina praecox]KAI5853380.1 hypothetical protein BZA05DRAFT_395869 [Tricharina praecox]
MVSCIDGIYQGFWDGWIGLDWIGLDGYWMGIGVWGILRVVWYGIVVCTEGKDRRRDVLPWSVARILCRFRGEGLCGVVRDLVSAFFRPYSLVSFFFFFRPFFFTSLHFSIRYGGGASTAQLCFYRLLFFGWMGFCGLVWF